MPVFRENSVLNKNYTNEYFNLSSWIIPVAMAIFLVVLSFYNFLFFHTLAEFFAITIAILMGVVAWQMYPFTRNNYLMYLGIGYFLIGILDLFHTLSYKGMNIMHGVSISTATEFWVGTRYLEAFLLLSAPWFLNHALNRKKIVVLFALISIVLTVIIIQGVFPVAFVEGVGLTTFKVISEYIIIGLLAASIFYLKKQKAFLDDKIINVMIVAIVLTMLAELVFTFYVSIYGLSNIVGHIFKLFSFWLIFMAIIKTTLHEPFRVMSRGASTYDAVPDATIVVDGNGIIRQANYAACQFARSESHDLIGKNNHDLFHPENIKVENCPVCHAIINNDEIRGLELEIDDQGHWFDFTLSHIAGASQLDGTVEVIRDITQRKQAEEKADELDILKNSIIENLPSMLFVKDAVDHRYIEWNKAAEELTGVLKSEMLGKTDLDFWPEEQARFFTEKDNEVVYSGKCIEIEREPLSTKQNGTRTLHTRKIPIYDSQGKAKYLLGIAEDITEKLKTEAMLSRSQKMEAVGQMSGGIAHDFNNQLGVILGYTDLLKALPLSPAHLKWLNAVHVAAERCAELTQQLLIFARNGEVDKTVVNLNTLICEMEVMIQRSLTPEVKFEYFMAEELWETEVNPGACKDAILNLVLNARDAMPKGGTLTIETNNVVINSEVAPSNIADGEYVQVVVTDTGVGMSPEVYEHVFEPFYTTKDVGKGTGLGLSMVYGFVNRYGGEIILDTQPDEGSTFRIYLPRSKANDIKKSESLNELTEFPAGHESILLVDDEEGLLTFAEHLLNERGYKVYSAKNAEEALKILQHSPIDLLFTDVVMPGELNGYALAEKALQMNQDIKVLITSGFAEKVGNNKEYEKYAFERITKPYNNQELARKLRQLLDE
jgi:PAS domain S-box-containing protein